MNVVKTELGWTIESPCVGRRLLYNRKTLEANGIDYDADPQGQAFDMAGISKEFWLRATIVPDQVRAAEPDHA